METNKRDIDTYLLEPVGCSAAHNLSYADRCEYIRSNEECFSQVYIVNYLELLYCTLRPNSPLAMVVCSAIVCSTLTIIFAIISITAEKFFCPTIQVLAKKFGLSEYIAGVTILAFGNGSPSFVSAFSADFAGNIHLVCFANSCAAALFIIGVVGSSICLTNTFRLQGYNVIRDIGFLLLTALYIDRVTYFHGSINLWDSIVIIAIYLIYVLIILVDQFLLHEIVKSIMRNGSVRYQMDGRNLTFELNKEVNFELYASQRRSPLLTEPSVINIELRRKSMYQLHTSHRDIHLEQIWEVINPFFEYKSLTIAEKALRILKSPIYVILTLSIPIVDYQLERHGWAKLLNCIQITAMPIILYLVFGIETAVYSTPILFVIPIVTCIVSVLVFFKTSLDVPPKYHHFLALYSLVGSILVLYICAMECTKLMSVMGLLTGYSVPFLNVTLLTWGASFTELISNRKIAERGYTKMCYAACIQRPFAHNVLSIGISFVSTCLSSSAMKFDVIRTDMVEIALTFAMILLFSILFFSISMDFYSRRSTAYFCISLYILFVLYCILDENSYIAGYSILNPNINKK